jgi:hypothetical protein
MMFLICFERKVRRHLRSRNELFITLQLVFILAQTLRSGISHSYRVNEMQTGIYFVKIVINDTVLNYKFIKK